MSERYISTDSTGWLRVKLEPSGRIEALPQYIKVDFSERRANRDFFKILEGVYAGSEASVSAKSSTTSWLATPLPSYRGPAVLTFNKRTGQMLTPIGSLRTKTDTANPIANGTHPIQLPDFPHDLGRPYLVSASKALTWFYLGIGNAVLGNNDRYLHPGRISAGCVTVEDIRKWDELYNVLILSRDGSRNVGSVNVQG